jgi:hypothetical protein
LAESFDGIFKPLLELFSLEKEEVALLPGGLFVFALIPFAKSSSSMQLKSFKEASQGNSFFNFAYLLLNVC